MGHEGWRKRRACLTGRDWACFAKQRLPGDMAAVWKYSAGGRGLFKLRIVLVQEHGMDWGPTHMAAAIAVNEFRLEIRRFPMIRAAWLYNSRPGRVVGAKNLPVLDGGDYRMHALAMNARPGLDVPASPFSSSHLLPFRYSVLSTGELPCISKAAHATPTSTMGRLQVVWNKDPSQGISPVFIEWRMDYLNTGVSQVVQQNWAYRTRQIPIAESLIEVEQSCITVGEATLGTDENACRVHSRVSRT